MANASNNLAACHQCPLRQYPCAGPCACADGADIITHADADYCPHPEGARFGNGRIPRGWKSRGLGDTLAKITSGVGIKPCRSCKERLIDYNERAPYRSTLTTTPS